MIGRRFVLLLFLSLAAMIGRTLAGLPDWAEGAAASLADPKNQSGDAVVLLDEWSLTIKSDQRVATRHWVLAVLTPQGASSALIRVSQDEFHHVNNLKAWSRDRRKNVTRYDSSDGTLVGLIESTSFEDSELLLLRPKRVCPGTIVALTYDLITSLDIPQLSFTVSDWQRVHLFRLSINAAPGLEPGVQVSGAKNRGGDVARGTARYEFTDVAGLRTSAEKNARVPSGIKLFINFASRSAAKLDSWGSVAQYGLGLFKRAGTKSKLYQQELAKVNASSDRFHTSSELARSLRYFGVENGWSGWIPRAPETALQRGFGDCKDKALLMSELLKDSGMEAIDVLIVSPIYRLVDPNVPAPFEFNHAIVGIPWGDRKVEPGMTVVDSPGIGALRLFDPTLPSGSPDDLSVLYDGATGLALDPRTTGPLLVPDRDANGNQHSLHCDWKWGEADLAHLECELQLSGTPRLAFMTESGRVVDNEAAASALLESLLPRCQGLDHLTLNSLDTTAGERWKLKFSFDCPFSATNFGATKLVHLPDFYSSAIFPLPDTETELVVHQPYLRRYDEEWAIEGAERFGDFPAAIAASNEFGSVSLVAERKGGVLVLRRSVSADKRDITRADQAKIHELQNALERVAAYPLPLLAAPAPPP